MNTVTTETAQADVLYYDGACPLCRTEMRHLSTMKSQNLELVDIHSLTELPHGTTRDDLLQRLHLRRGDRWLTGVEANVGAWSHTRIGLLWRLLTLPGLRGIVNWVYTLWAERRFANRYGARDQQRDSS
jgi:predicted DCC family thiol-disulfide oxidoreductase YuxK